MALLFNRADGGCVDCPLPFTGSCPDCGDNEECVLASQTCSSCAEYYCASKTIQGASTTSSGTSGTGSSTASASSLASTGSSRSSSAGIAGGVSAGIVVLAAIVAFVVWRVFFSKKSKRRQAQYMRNEGTEMTYPVSIADDDMTANDNTWQDGEKFTGYDRVSVSTMGPRSASAFSRASNIIPIAYLPGAGTNQLAESSKYNLPQHGFSAEDLLRGSVVSQTPIIRDSLADYDPRQSNIVVSSGAMTAIQVKPNLIQLSNQPQDRFSTLEEGKTISQFISNGVTGDISRDSMASISTTASYGQGSRYYQAEPVVEIGSRANARSIRIGKAAGHTGLASGLQSEYILEELSEEENEPELQNQYSEFYHPNLSSQSIQNALMQGDIPINLSFDTRFSQFSNADSNQGDNRHSLRRGAEDDPESLL